MNKYLKQLLENYAKVILPSFGAIVIENEETGNLMFNEYLSYNDGKLDDFIVNESNMELQEAQNMIAKYIRDIQAELDKGGSYDIFELGRFYKNKDGEIEFEGNLKEGLKPQSKKDSPKVATKMDSESDKKKEETPKPKEDKKETKVEPKKEESKKETKVDSKEVKKETKPESKSTEKENKFVAKKENNEADANKAKLKADPIKKKEEAKANKAKLKADARKKKEEAKANRAKLKADAKKKQQEAKANKAKLKADAKTSNKVKASDSPKAVKVKNEKTSKDPKKKKRFGTFFWVAITILTLASAGLIYIGLNYKEVKSYMGWDKFDDKEKVDSKETSDKTKAEDQESIEFDAKENTATDTTAASNVEFDEEGNEIKEEEQGVSKTETKPVPSPEPKQTQTSSTGSHHLIAGSFSNLSNAEKLVEDLKSKGLDARIIGEFGGLHFVAAASYNSSKEARADINRIRQIAPGSWIFKYNNK